LKELKSENVQALADGFCNLEKHIENMQSFGVPVVVSINKFITDSDAEIAYINDRCAAMDNVRVALCEGWEHGGNGTKELAQKVVDAVESCTQKFIPAYDLDMSVKEKIEAVATKIYGAGTVTFQPKALLNLKRIDRLGLGHLPICMAKTQNSISDNPKLKGRPEGFELTVREIEFAAGAGFVIPITGAMLRMPGLPAVPAAEGIDIDAGGNISGLS